MWVMNFGGLHDRLRTLPQYCVIFRNYIRLQERAPGVILTPGDASVAWEITNPAGDRVEPFARKPDAAAGTFELALDLRHLA